MPSAQALNYGQSVFEGMKARQPPWLPAVCQQFYRVLSIDLAGIIRMHIWDVRPTSRIALHIPHTTHDRQIYRSSCGLPLCRSTQAVVQGVIHGPLDRSMPTFLCF